MVFDTKTNRIVVDNWQPIIHARKIAEWFLTNSEDRPPPEVFDYAAWFMLRQYQEAIKDARMECAIQTDKFYEHSSSHTMGIGRLSVLDIYSWVEFFLADQIDQHHDWDPEDIFRPITGQVYEDGMSFDDKLYEYSVDTMWNLERFKAISIYMVINALLLIKDAQTEKDGELRLRFCDGKDTQKDASRHYGELKQVNFRSRSDELGLDWDFAGRGLTILLHYIFSIDFPRDGDYEDTNFDVVELSKATIPYDYSDETFKTIIGI